MGRWGRGRHCTGERPDGDAGALPRPGEGDAQLAGACLLPGRDARAEERRGIRGWRRRGRAAAAQSDSSVGRILGYAMAYLDHPIGPPMSMKPHYFSVYDYIHRQLYLISVNRKNSIQINHFLVYTVMS